MLLKARHGRRERADRRAGAVEFLHGVGFRGIGGSNQRRLVTAAGINQLAGVGFQRSDKNRAEALEVRVRLNHGVDGGQGLGGGKTNRKAVGQQFAHVLGLLGLLRAMPGDIADDHGDLALVPGVGIQGKRRVEVAARGRRRGQVGERGTVFRRQRFLPQPQRLRLFKRSVHAYLL